MSSHTRMARTKNHNVVEKGCEEEEETKVETYWIRYEGKAKERCHFQKTEVETYVS